MNFFYLFLDHGTNIFLYFFLSNSTSMDQMNQDFSHLVLFQLLTNFQKKILIVQYGISYDTNGILYT